MESYKQNYNQGPMIAQFTSCGLDLNGKLQSLFRLGN